MNNSGNIRWLFNVRFVIKALAGITVTLLLVYLFTLPSISPPLFEAEAVGFAPGYLRADHEPENATVTDVYIQIIRSSVMMDTLNALFDLFGWYGIKPDYPQAKAQLYHKIGQRVSAEKTRYGSVSVKVLDPDPRIASEMANRILILGDVIQRKIFDKITYQSAPGAYIITRATPDFRPERPNRKLLLLLGTGFILFVLIALEIIRRDYHTQIPDN